MPPALLSLGDHACPGVCYEGACHACVPDKDGCDGAPRNVQGTTKAKLAWHLTSTIPIIAYQFNPLENEGVFSNDASMLIPTNVLGKRYRVLTWSERVGALRAYVTVVGVGPGATSVTVTSTAKTLGGSEVPALAPGG